MKCADEILAGLEVDAGLAADGRVHLRQQCGRDLYDWNSAHEDRCEKRADIADNSATESQQNRLPIGPGAHHLLGKLFQLRQRLRALSIRHDEELEVKLGFAETFLQRLRPMFSDGR